MEGSGRRLERALAARDGGGGEPAAPLRAREILLAGEEFFSLPPGGDGPEERALGHLFLDATSAPDFLEALGDPPLRHRWADTCFAAIRRSSYSLETLLEQRCGALGARTLFEEFGRDFPARWSYSRVRAKVRSFAAALLSAGGGDPRVALYLDNGVDGACADLACLAHDLLVAPLSVHFGGEELAWIFDRLSINLAVSDTEERLRLLLAVRRKTRIPFRIFSVRPGRLVDGGEVVLLMEAAARLAPEEEEGLLAGRRRRGLDEICTVMFTSGSTGRPKGVAFSPFHLLTKRFARAAALPGVGNDEILFCYLPLYHTFGRYLEMLGTLFWRGTYVFAGNPSLETLLAGMRQVRPTGLISIPLRWAQLRDLSLQAMERAPSAAEREGAFRDLVGGRLRWGLSAAGYLEPKVFQHFNRLGVRLCSGFGMTEATGGITMSPPGDYVPGSVGQPLPGIRVRLAGTGEMRIAGPYVARYLEEEGRGLELSPGILEEGEEWLATGDMFRRLERGHLSIVDRIKDIYKNDRGQTIAPNHVERKFHGVPGIRRTFLVGDHRSYNVLLIVPDPEDPVLREAPGEEDRREYFHRIVAAANQDLAPYERVVNFALLDRDFAPEKGELTAKGSFRRRAIEENFAAVIESLYQSPWVELSLDSLRVRLPRWLFRDLGLLEDEIRPEGRGLFDRRRGVALPLHREAGEPLVRVGDLDYRVADGTVDLGIFARQPRLWMGNPSLIRFAPCREGWDTALGSVSGEALLPRGASREPHDLTARPRGISDALLLEVNGQLQTALYGSVERAVPALERLSRDLEQSDRRLAGTIRGRLAALSRHDHEIVRCLAYRILLLDEPAPGYSEDLSVFIDSGLSFLDEQSITAIAGARFEKRRLQLLRQRLSRYRTRLSWPAGEGRRLQIGNILSLLVGFAHRHPEYYKPVRAELTCWVLHREDPRLSALAQELLHGLSRWFEASLEAGARRPEPSLLPRLIRFDDEIPAPDRERLLHLLVETGFLRQSVVLAFDEQDFQLDQIGVGGAWVSRMQSRGRYLLYRVSVNTKRHRHYDLLVILRDDMDAAAVMHTNYWMVAIGDHPYGDRTLPRFGCVRGDLAAMSLEYVKDLTVAEKIRELAGIGSAGEAPAREREWRKLFVRALATVFHAWNNSARRIVPGSVDPANVAVPELDYHEGSVLLSLAGWEPYRDTLSLFRPILRTFYDKTRVLYPETARLLRHEWIFEACREALGGEVAREVLLRFRSEAREAEEGSFEGELLESLDRWLEDLSGRYHPPLPLTSAIDRFDDWCRSNPAATPEARAQLLDQLIELYDLGRFGEIARYHLYLRTAFAGAAAPAREAFGRLLEGMGADPARSAAERAELSDLQAALPSEGDRTLFTRMVFPRTPASRSLEVMAFGEGGQRQATVRTRFTDNRGESYHMREPVEPEEIGQLYRLFFQERFPKKVSELDRHLVATDSGDRVVGGLCYRLEGREVAHLDGVVVNGSVAHRGIATALLEDFATRMASRGIKVLRTGYIMRDFCEQRGFRLDRRWGGLVRLLAGESGGRDAPPAPQAS